MQPLEESHSSLSGIKEGPRSNSGAKMTEEDKARARAGSPVADLDDEHYRKSEIAAALVHLYYLHGIDLNAKPRPIKLLTELLGVSRQTVWRCLNDAADTVDLAVEMKKRLTRAQEAQEKEKLKRKMATQVAYDKRRNERAKAKRAETREARLAANRERRMAERQQMQAGLSVQGNVVTSTLR